MKEKFDMAQYLNKASQPNQDKKGNTVLTTQIKQVSVYDLEPNPDNFYGVRDIESLAAMIEMQGGIMTPLEVKALQNGKYVIIAGHRRRAAMLYLLEQGSEKITSPLVPVIVKSYQDKKAEIIALIFSNRGQRKRTADEITEEINLLRPIAKEIFDNEKYKGNALGRFRKFFAEEILQISEASLQRKTQLKNLTDDVKKELDKGSLTMTAASELAGLKPEKQNKILAQIKDKDGPVTVKNVQKEKEKLRQLESEGQQKMFVDRENNDGEQQRELFVTNESFLDGAIAIQNTLLEYKKQITHEFINIVSKIQEQVENPNDVNWAEDLTNLEELLNHISAEISHMKLK